MTFYVQWVFKRLYLNRNTGGFRSHQPDQRVADERIVFHATN